MWYFEKESKVKTGDQYNNQTGSNVNIGFILDLYVAKRKSVE